MAVVMMMVMMIMAFVVMIVVMGVGGDHAGGGWPEQPREFRVLLHLGGRAFAADMPVEADHMVALGHDHVKIVADHEDTAAMTLADLGNEFVHTGFAHEIDGLHGFVEHQQLGLAQQGTRQEGTLQFAAREPRDAGRREVGNSRLAQGLFDLLRRRP